MAEPSSFQVFLFLTLAVVVIYVGLSSRDVLRSGFLLFIWLLGLGYRTYAVSPELKIIPAELVLIGLFFLVNQSKMSLPGRGLPGRDLPGWLLVMMPFWLVAWFPSEMNHFSLYSQIAEFRNFLLAVPIFCVGSVVLQKPGGWRGVVFAMLGMSTWIATMGILEHALPGVASSIPGFSSNSQTLIAGSFERAKFSFFGSPTGVFICVMSYPLTVVAWDWVKSGSGRVALVTAAFLQLLALYISGYRSMWLVVALQFAVFVAIRKKVVLGAAGIVFASVAYGLLPAATQERVQSLINVLDARPDEIDTSGKKRWARAMEAWDAVLANPLGHGWAASGWVHSDFIQVAANQGWIPGVALFMGYVAALFQLVYRTLRIRTDDPLAPMGVPLLLGFVAVGAILLYEGVEFLPQTMLPVWVFWAASHVWLRMTAPAERGRSGWVSSHAAGRPSLTPRIQPLALPQGTHR